MSDSLFIAHIIFHMSVRPPIWAGPDRIHVLFCIMFFIYIQAVQCHWTGPDSILFDHSSAIENSLGMEVYLGAQSQWRVVRF